MKTDLSFFYKNKTSNETYTAQPNNNLVIHRLLQNEPQFFLQEDSAETKCKTLIFADYSYANRPVAERKKIKNAIDASISQYKWLFYTDYGLTPENSTGCTYILNQNKKNLQLHAEIIQQAIVKYKLTRDQIKIMDDYWLNFMADLPADANHRVVNISSLRTTNMEYYYNSNEIDIDRLYNIMKQAKPKITTIIHDEFSAELNKIATQLKKLIEEDLSPSKPTFEKKYTKLRLAIQALDDMDADKEIIIDGCTLAPADLATIELLDFYDDPDMLLSRLESSKEEKLLALIKTMPKLQSCILSDPQRCYPRLLALPNEANANITVAIGNEILDLRGYIASLDVLNISLPKSEQIIETIKINNEILTAINKCYFKHLTAFFFENKEAINYATIEDFCARHHETLTTLEISGKVIVDSVPPQLTMLKKLKINEIDAHSLAQLLEAAPNIKSLDLSSLTNQTAGITFKLSLVESINIDATISNDCLTQFLQAPQLKSISFKAEQISGFESTLKNLTKLKNLTLHTKSITAASFRTLFTNMAGIQYINFEGDIQPSDAGQSISDMLFPDFSALDTIALKFNAIDHSWVFNLLNKAPNLCMIELTSTSDGSEQSDLFANISAAESIQWKNLRYITLNHFTLKPNTFYNFLCTEKPSQISLTGCKFLGQLDENNRTLKISGQPTIDLYNMTITADLVSMLNKLAAAAGGRTITIKVSPSCTFESNEIALQFNNMPDNIIVINPQPINSDMKAAPRVLSPPSGNKRHIEVAPSGSEQELLLQQHQKLAENLANHSPLESNEIKEQFFNNIPDNISDNISDNITVINPQPINSDITSTVDLLPLEKAPSGSEQEPSSQQYQKPAKNLADHSQPLDADTSNKERPSIAAQQYFYPLSAAEKDIPKQLNYRCAVYNTTALAKSQPQGIHGPFQLTNEGDLALSNTDEVIQCNDQDSLLSYGLIHNQKDLANQYFIGKKNFELTTDWEAIPSLAADESITHIYSTAQDYEMQYSRRDNLYYIRAKTKASTDVPVKLTLDFILKKPTQVDTTSQLPNKIKNLIEEIKKYDIGALTFQGNNPTAKEYLDTMLQQKRGACRHRTFAFMECLKIKNIASQEPVKTRIVNNDLHSFIEININGSWQPIDLGGYPANANTKDNFGEEYAKKIKDQQKMLATPELAEGIQQNEKDIQKAQRQEEQWRNAFATWEQRVGQLTAVKEYCLQAITTNDANDQKKLYQVSSTKDAQYLQIQLQKTCRDIGRPYFFVNRPADLICSAPYIKREDKEITLQRGPGGPLHNFLQQYKDPANPVLIVNYDNFNHDDLVRFNSLLDGIRQADGTNLPANTLVIGIINTQKPDCYQGSDFYSRFNKIESLPKQELTSNLLIPTAQDFKQEDVVKQQDNEIDCFVSSGWENYLLGNIAINGDKFSITDGVLIETNSEKRIKINILPELWDNPDFQLFLLQAKNLGYFNYNGQTINFPHGLNNVEFVLHSEYPWKKLTNQVIFANHQYDEQQHQILNRESLANAIKEYEYKDYKFYAMPGFLTKAANSQLKVYLTSNLNLDEWGKLLSNCQRLQVILHVDCAPGITIPIPSVNYNPTKLISPTYVAANKKLLLESNKTLVIHSNDLDSTLKSIDCILSLPPSWLVFDISECKPADLLIYTSYTMDHGTLTLKFTQTIQDFLQALKDNKNIILKGSFTAELEAALTPILLQRLALPDATNSLLLLNDRAEVQFNFMPQYQHHAAAEEKKEYLQQIFNSIESVNNLLAQYPLAPLQARLNYQKLNPVADSSAAWQGMKDLPANIAIKEYNLQQAQTIANEFQQGREAAVQRILAQMPFVILTGLTGVGKSTFVQQVYPQAKHGTQELVQWATSTENNPVLFIDEANLHNTQWSMFEGLFNKSPSILIKGKYYELTAAHKVIFACNPVSYGDERQLPTFFARHGGALIFQPLPPEYIYLKILQPIFVLTKLSPEELSSFCTPILDIYVYLCNKSITQVLITARELQMMALLIMNYINPEDIGNRQLNKQEVAKYYAYEIAKDLIPAVQTWKNEFIEKFSPRAEMNPITSLAAANQEINQAVPHHGAQPSARFVVTQSRKLLSQRLDELLSLRALRRQSKDMNDAQKYGGLGGIIIEGEPGIGKSELVIYKLTSIGLKEGIDFERIPPSMGFSEKRNKLREAFFAGRIVIIDEINSSPMMEKELNDLLMGHCENKRPNQPGFLVIGTQNPVSMAGRRLPSNALARRMLTTVLPPYPQEELVQLLIHKGLRNDDAQRMVTIFREQMGRAESEKLQPAPTVRNLFDMAAQVVTAQHKKASAKQQAIAQPGSKDPQELKAIENLLSHTLFGQPNQQFQQAQQGNINAITPHGWQVLCSANNVNDAQFINTKLEIQQQVATGPQPGLAQAEITCGVIPQVDITSIPKAQILQLRKGVAFTQVIAVNESQKKITRGILSAKIPSEEYNQKDLVFGMVRQVVFLIKNGLRPTEKNPIVIRGGKYEVKLLVVAALQEIAEKYNEAKWPITFDEQQNTSAAQQPIRPVC